MELTIAVIISIISVVITILNFAFSRKDKAVKESKDESSNQALIEYRLTQVENKLDKILEFLDKQNDEIDIKIDKAIEEHIKLYHKEAK